MNQTSDSYYSIVHEFNAEFKDRASKFIAYLRPISTEDEFDKFLSELKSLHHKANHHCFAYRLKDADQFRYSDDGEPSGTAGKPIYNQLKANDLRDIACIVVRYFGGTKLGTSGLINAYRESSKLVINSAKIVQFFICKKLKIKFDYALMGQLIEHIKSLDYTITEKKYDADPSMTIEVRRSEFNLAEAKIKSKFLKRDLEDITTETTVEGLSFFELEEI